MVPETSRLVSDVRDVNEVKMKVKALEVETECTDELVRELDRLKH